MIARVEDVAGGGSEESVPAGDDAYTRADLVRDTMDALANGAGGKSADEIRDRVIAETYATSVELQRMLDAIDRLDESGPFGRMLAKAIRRG